MLTFRSLEIVIIVVDVTKNSFFVVIYSRFIVTNCFKVFCKNFCKVSFCKINSYKICRILKCL